MEQNRARAIVWNGLCTVPHRDYSQLVPHFSEALDDDPYFVSRAMVETYFRSKIRDQVDSAVITLLQADPDFPEFREAGRCLLLGKDYYNIADGYASLDGLPPHRILRVDYYIRHSHKKIPRLMKSIAHDFLESLQSNPRRFDGVIMRPNGRKGIKAMYKAYHVAANAYAKSILWDNTPPEGSMPYIVQQINATDNLLQKATLVIENDIPYEVAASLLPKTTEASIALVDIMTPQQALNSRSWVERSGILNIPEVKAVYLAKIGKATASIATADFRRSSQGQDADVQAAVTQAQEKAIQHSDRIERNTLILVDKSSSMTSAIEFAQHVASRIAPLCDGELGVVAFDTGGYVVKMADYSLAGCRAAFKTIRADGWTSVGAGLSRALSYGFTPEQIVIITDEGENRRPYYVSELENYVNTTGIDISTIILNICGYYNTHDHSMGDSLSHGGFNFERFDINRDDYYILDQVAQLLTGPKGKTIVDVILERDLPYRVGH